MSCWCGRTRPRPNRSSRRSPPAGRSRRRCTGPRRARCPRRTRSAARRCPRWSTGSSRAAPHYGRSPRWPPTGWSVWSGSSARAGSTWHPGSRARNPRYSGWWRRGTRRSTGPRHRRHTIRPGARPPRRRRTPRPPRSPRRRACGPERTERGWCPGTRPPTRAGTDAGSTPRPGDARAAARRSRRSDRRNRKRWPTATVPGTRYRRTPPSARCDQSPRGPGPSPRPDRVARSCGSRWPWRACAA